MTLEEYRKQKSKPDISEQLKNLNRLFETLNAINLATSSIDYDQLAETISARLDVSMEILTSPRRFKPYVMARIVFAGTLHQCGCPIPKIAQIMKKDRATIYNMLENSRNLAYLEEIKALKLLIQ